MIDLTNLLEIIITLAATLASVFLIPWLKSKTTAEQREDMLKWVDIAVAAAQQLYYEANGSDRLAYALELLQAKGFNVEDVALQDAVEAAVLKLHHQLKESV